MEKSFLTFVATYPTWQPSAGGRAMLASIASQAEAGPAGGSVGGLHNTVRGGWAPPQSWDRGEGMASTGEQRGDPKHWDPGVLKGGAAGMDGTANRKLPGVCSRAAHAWGRSRAACRGGVLARGTRRARP